MDDVEMEIVSKYWERNKRHMEEEFEFLPRILDALAQWNRHFKHIFIVTN
jgi:hypothetical protein